MMCQNCRFASEPYRDKFTGKIEYVCSIAEPLVDAFGDSIDRTVNPSDTRNIANLDNHFNKVLRHEIVHAFLDESGLMENAKFDDEHFEQMVDWIAIQFPKMQKAFEEVGCL